MKNLMLADTLFRRSIPAFLIGAALLLQGCDGSPQGGAPLPGVTYMQVEPQTVTLTTELPGRVSAYMISEVRPQVSGIIQQRLFVEGSDVKQGDVLYQIDPSLYQAAYDNARASLMRAEANEIAAKLLAERYEKVVKVNAVSKQDYDNAVAAYRQAEAEVHAAKAALDTAEINLAYTKVTAPVSGRIGRSTITPGALVTQNQPAPLATIQQLDKMYVDVTQSSTEMLRLRQALEGGQLTRSGDGALATLLLENGNVYTTRKPVMDEKTGEQAVDENGRPVFRHEPVVGQLKFSEATVEQSTGVVIIRAEFSNPDNILLPGMYARAIVEEGVDDSAILIPRMAVERNNRGQPFIRVLNRNASAPAGEFDIETRTIEVDRQIKNDWFVRGGLQKGEFLMLQGSMLLRGATKVQGTLDPAYGGQNAAKDQTPVPAEADKQ